MDTHSSPLPRLRAVNRIAHFTKTEKVPENTLSHEEDLHLSLHDSLDSDSESLVQERMYQFELQRRIHENEQLVNKTPTENQDDSENEDDNELWDSLEESSNSEGRRSLKLEHVNSILQKNTLSRQHSLNKYADLHYDPNWKNIQGPRWEFTHETRQHLQDSLEDLFEDSSDLADEDESSAGETDNFYIEKSSVSSKASQAVEFSFRDHVNRKQRKALGAGNSNRKQRQSSEAEDKLEQVSTPVYLKEGKTVSSSSLHSPSKSKFGFPMSSGPEDTFNIDPNADCDPPYKRAAVVVQHPNSYQLNDWQPEEKFEVAEKQSMAYKAEMICKRDNGNIPSKQYLPTNSNKVRSIHSPKNTNPKKDIIEKNKLTLGVSTRKNGSYVKLLSRRKEDVENKTCLHVAAGQESFQVPSETENTSMDPEERWHQRAQKLKTRRHKTLQPDVKQNNQLAQGHPELLTAQQTSGGNAHKMYFKERKHLNSVRLNNQHINSRSPRGFYIERSDHTSQFLPSGGGNILSNTSSPNLYNMDSLPTVNLNINVNAPSECTPSVSCDHSQATINLISSHRPPQQTPSALLNYNELNSPKSQLSMHSGDHQCSHAAFCDQQSSLVYGYPGYLPSQSPDRFIKYQHFQKHRPNELHAQYIMNYNESKGKVESSPHHIERQLNSKKHSKRHIGNGLPAIPKSLLNDVNMAHPPVTLPAHQMQYPFQEASWLPQFPYSIAVLPPVIQRVDSDSELYHGEEEEKQKAAVHRSNSESCITQVLKQEGFREKHIYKPYTLSDYKNLKQDIKLGGLGPDYHSAQETAEKLRRQKEYAALIRELNKKSTVPISPQSKPPLSPGNKRILSRQKALEYAKRIPRPKPAIKAENSKYEASGESYQKISDYVEEIDLSQLSKLRMLQQRHEKEKEAIAAFRALHVS